MEFTKFLLYFKVEDDPEVYELLCDQICKKMTTLNIDELLTILVNLTQTLSPEVAEVWTVSNNEIVERLNQNFDPIARQVFI